MADEEREQVASDDKKRLAARLRELRAARGLTQTELAERAGVSERAITQWERGVREPSWTNVLALCRALDVDCTAFVQQPEQELPAPGPGRPRKHPPSGAAEGQAAEQADESQPPRQSRQKKG